MLVEDDNNLREIYEARLLAEGYEIVSAQDGEEALALAVKEKPDLIIADVMMPKISGFDMLDILRTTPETKDVKVVMMTALSQAEDKARADKLGADRYLVKSQVTLEDVAKVAREVLGEGGQPAGDSPPPASADDSSTTASTPPAEPPASTEPPVPDEPSNGPGSSTTDDIPDGPITSPSPITPPADNTATTNMSEDTKTENKEVETQIQNFINTAPLTTPQVDPVSTSTASPAQSADDNNNAVLNNAMAAMDTKSVTNKLPEDPRTNPDYDTASNAPPKSIPITSDREQEATTSVHTKIITPINDLSKQGANLQELLAKEEARESGNVITSEDGVNKSNANLQELLAKEEAKEAGNTSTPPSTTPTSGVDPNSISL